MRKVGAESYLITLRKKKLLNKPEEIMCLVKELPDVTIDIEAEAESANSHVPAKNVTNLNKAEVQGDIRNVKSNFLTTTKQIIFEEKSEDGILRTSLGDAAIPNLIITKEKHEDADPNSSLMDATNFENKLGWILLFTHMHSKCFDNPKTEEQKDKELRAEEQYKEEISSLPQERGWQHRPLRLYKNFWFGEAILPGVLSLRHHLQPLPSDIFLASFPKSGTTWLKAIVFAISTRNPDSLLSRHPQDCSPHLERLFSGPNIPNLDVLPFPRILGTHIPYSILPKSVHDSPCRIVYLCREPKDTLVSTFHFINGLRRPEAALQPIPFVEAVENFYKGVTMYGPVWEHQLEYWRESRRRPEKVLFLKYEEMKADVEAIVKRIAEFIGMAFSVEEEMNGMVGEIVRVTSFEKLSGLEVNKVGVRSEEKDLILKRSAFFRKGKVGDWREHLTVDMAQRLDDITRERLHQNGLIHSHLQIEASDLK